jgi:predicted DNA-binding ribbon-helix-helix protein
MLLKNKLYGPSCLINFTVPGAMSGLGNWFILIICLLFGSYIATNMPDESLLAARTSERGVSGRMGKYSFTIKRHRTSISLEEPFYEALVDIARELNKTVPELIGEIDDKSRESGLSSTIRVYVLDYYRSKSD